MIAHLFVLKIEDHTIPKIRRRNSWHIISAPTPLANMSWGGFCTATSTIFQSPEALFVQKQGLTSFVGCNYMWDGWHSNVPVATKLYQHLTSTKCINYIYVYIYMVQRRPTTPPPPCGWVMGCGAELWMGHGLWGCGGALLVSDAADFLWWGSSCFWCCWLSLVSSASPPLWMWGCGVGLCLCLMPPPPLWMGHGLWGCAVDGSWVVGLWWGSACFWCCWLSVVGLFLFLMLLTFFGF